MSEALYSLSFRRIEGVALPNEVRGEIFALRAIVGIRAECLNATEVARFLDKLRNDKEQSAQPSSVSGADTFPLYYGGRQGSGKKFLLYILIKC
jgi:hypothetical protein